MYNNYKFSVICPCFNSQAYVRKAIESVLFQSYKNLELILIDDGSTDSTFEILNEYKKKDDRVVVFHKDNGGYCSAVNLGLEHITGDYFLLLGSDDFLDRDILSNIVKKINDFSPDMIGFKTVQISEDGTERQESNTDYQKDIFFKGDYKAFSEQYSFESIIFRLRDTSKCFKTSLLYNQRYFGKYGYDADGIFSLLFSHKSNSFMVIKNVGYFWQLRSNSVSGRKLSIDVNIDRLQNWTKYLNELINSSYLLSTGDISYSKIGFRICSEISNDKFKCKNFRVIKHYCKSFKLFKKRTFISVGKRMIFNIYFSFLSYLFKLF